MGRLIPLIRGPAQDGELSDEALLAACAVGDSSALGALFDRHHHQVHRYFRRVLGPSVDLEDLVQSCFLELWRAARSYSGRASVRAFILGIASNLFRHHVRGEVRKRNALRALSAIEPTEPAPADQASDARRLLARLERAVLELPEDLRITFVMCELEEVDRAEAARVLGVRPGSIGRRIHEARKELKAALEEAR
jgi:RNA polymerase sigma-70 factor (ECF subfamily)